MPKRRFKMSLPRPDPVVSTQYLQVKLPRDVQSSGDDLSTGSGSNVGVEDRQTISNSTGDSSPQRRRNGASSVPSCISSTVINLMPSINTAPVASGSNCYFQTRDFQSEEAKQVLLCGCGFNFFVVVLIRLSFYKETT